MILNKKGDFMGRFIERTYPYIVSGLVCLLLLLDKSSSYKIIRLEFTLNSVITFSVTYIGFVITAITILIGLTERKVLKLLHEKGFTTLIVEYFMSSIIIGTIIILYSFYLGYLIPSDNSVSKIQLIGFVELFLSFLFCLIRITSLMMKIFSLIQNEPEVFNEEIERVEKDKPFSNNINKKDKSF